VSFVWCDWCHVPCLTAQEHGRREETFTLHAQSKWSEPNCAKSAGMPYHNSFGTRLLLIPVFRRELIEDLSVPVVVSWCELCFIYTRPSLNAVILLYSPGARKPPLAAYKTYYRIDYKLASLVHKQSTVDRQASLSLSVDQRLHAYTRQSRSSKQLFLLKPPVRTEIARRAFSQAAPTVWNDLPLDSRSAETYERFRSATKNHFYELAFTNWSRACFRSHDSFFSNDLWSVTKFI